MDIVYHALLFNRIFWEISFPYGARKEICLVSRISVDLIYVTLIQFSSSIPSFVYLKMVAPSYEELLILKLNWTLVILFLSA